MIRVYKVYAVILLVPFFCAFVRSMEPIEGSSTDNSETYQKALGRLYSRPFTDILNHIDILPASLVDNSNRDDTQALGILKQFLDFQSGSITTAQQLLTLIENNEKELLDKRFTTATGYNKRLLQWYAYLAFRTLDHLRDSSEVNPTAMQVFWSSLRYQDSVFLLDVLSRNKVDAYIKEMESKNKTLIFLINPHCSSLIKELFSELKQKPASGPIEFHELKEEYTRLKKKANERELDSSSTCCEIFNTYNKFNFIEKNYINIAFAARTSIINAYLKMPASIKVLFKYFFYDVVEKIISNPLEKIDSTTSSVIEKNLVNQWYRTMWKPASQYAIDSVRQMFWHALKQSVHNFLGTTKVIPFCKEFKITPFSFSECTEEYLENTFLKKYRKYCEQKDRTTDDFVLFNVLEEASELKHIFYDWASNLSCGLQNKYKIILQNNKETITDYKKAKKEYKNDSLKKEKDRLHQENTELVYSIKDIKRLRNKWGVVACICTGTTAVAHRFFKKNPLLQLGTAAGTIGSCGAAIYYQYRINTTVNAVKQKEARIDSISKNNDLYLKKLQYRRLNESCERQKVQLESLRAIKETVDSYKPQLIFSVAAPLSTECMFSSNTDL